MRAVSPYFQHRERGRHTHHSSKKRKREKIRETKREVRGVEEKMSKWQTRECVCGVCRAHVEVLAQEQQSQKGQNTSI